ncbi:ABC transporter permease [Streptomyces sp. NPDC049954]|uniref:ABC transporter permease n=1 Tax=Streptomyces sp. NPDC049954 TaxID=3155779 RepID=UPI00343D9229
MSTPTAPRPPHGPLPPASGAPHPGPGQRPPYGQQGPWAGQAPAGYESPIPVVRVHLGHALLSEWTKIRSVRSTVWTLGVFFLLVLGIGVLFTTQVGEQLGRTDTVTLFAFPGLLLGSICIMTLGVLVVTSEYGTGLIRPTLTASPQRHRVLLAKILVFSGLTFVVGLVSVGLVSVIAEGSYAGAGGDWGGPALLATLYVSLLGVLALAVGSMLRHSAGAITTMLAAMLVPSILPAFLMISASTKPLGELMMEYSAPTALTYLTMPDGADNGHHQLLFLVVVTAAAVGGAFALLERRDV